jgi:predicted site-specific integrase-resolvase
MNTYNITQFAGVAGEAVKTLLYWDCEGRLQHMAQTPGNRRSYTQEQLNKLLINVPKTEQVTVIYLRVSSQAQKNGSVGNDR